jgi:SAM-dependent methyltransferase
VTGDDAEHRHRQHLDHRARPTADTRTWDAFYATSGDGAPRWSGLPNGSLVVEVADLEPGTALDVGCGEGADAIWLAHRGWKVTALDPSAVALERAASAAALIEITVTWQHGGLIELAGELNTFDLVSVQYGVLPLDTESTAIRLLCRAVAPGGTLLVVHHELDLAHHGHDSFDPAAHVMPDDVAAHLGSEWQIETYERRDRRSKPTPEAPHVRDIVLRARHIDESASPRR